MKSQKDEEEEGEEEEEEEEERRGPESEVRGQSRTGSVI